METPETETKPLTFTTPEALHIAHDCTSETYRAAKARATSEGRQLIIDPRPAEKPVATPAGTVIIPKNADVQTYRRMKADAETRGVPFQIGQ